MDTALQNSRAKYLLQKHGVTGMITLTISHTSNKAQFLPKGIYFKVDKAYNKWN